MNTQTPSPNSGHRKRLRTRFINGGATALHDYEKIELLLTYCIPRRDVKPLAKNLFAVFGSVQNIMNATVEELCEIDGIGENCAALILLIKELCCTYLEEQMPEKAVIHDLTAAVNFARMKIGGAAKETYMLIFLDSRNQILKYECFLQGTIDHTTIYSREIITLAIKYRAKSIIVIHNHPSGICMPSAEDLNATVKICKALAAVNVILHDHIIVTASDFYSMNAHKELPKF